MPMLPRAHDVLTVSDSTSGRADLLQITKGVVAAVAAWYVCEQIIGLSASFLAPWTALLTVQATIYRSFARGGSMLAATLLGIGLSYLVVEALGYGVLALGVALLIGLLLAKIRQVHDQTTIIATTALFVITGGQAEQAPMLLDRVLGTGIGVGIALLVNFVVFAPLDEKVDDAQIDRVCRSLGALMQDMAEQLGSGEELEPDEWIERTRETDLQLAHAHAMVRHTREARVGNPRRTPSSALPDYDSVLTRLEDGVAQVRAIARSIELSHRVPQSWLEHFRREWIPLLGRIGARVADPDATVGDLRPDLEALVRGLSERDELPSNHWPLYGSLIDSMQKIIDVVDDVASSRPVRV